MEKEVAFTKKFLKRERDPCIICMKNPEGKELAAVFNCRGNHVFHYECISEYMRICIIKGKETSLQCPVCTPLQDLLKSIPDKSTENVEFVESFYQKLLVNFHVFKKNTACLICHDYIEGDFYFIGFKECNDRHTFHCNCIKDYIKHKDRCPICVSIDDVIANKSKLASKWLRKFLEKIKSENRICDICNNIMYNETRISFDCHEFHEKCMKEILKFTTDCPLCMTLKGKSPDIIDLVTYYKSLILSLKTIEKNEYSDAYLVKTTASSEEIRNMSEDDLKKMIHDTNCITIKK